MKKALATIILCFIVVIAVCWVKTDSTPKETLYGSWGVENITWLYSTEDSIYFVDEENSPAIKYYVEKDTITMNFDGMTIKEKYYIIQDTLFMETKEGLGKYERIK